ncbi:hypothetical protein BBJ28_00010969 [Nothophytophthora sp. Chile5]|nr:hypothetical protein BBJ28_00010969 [Nothophytophthora sp. Chile5]
MFRHHGGSDHGSSGLCAKTADVVTVLDDVPLQAQETPEDQPLVVAKAAPAPAKILFLDGVRGLAAILVVTQHSGEYLHDLDLGACAVDAFFVLSSFLLTMLFLKKSSRLLSQHASYRKWTFALADYFSKRFFRVYPLFATVAVVLWLLPFEAKHHYYLVKEPGQFNLFKVLTFDFPQRYFVFWTLPLEISYYFFIPVFVLAVLKLRRFWWAPLLPLYAWVVYEGWNNHRSSHSPLRPHFPTFLAGSMAAVLFVKLDAWIKSSGFEFRRWHKVAIRSVEYLAIALLLSVCLRRNVSQGEQPEPSLLFYWVHENIAPTTPGFPFISVLLTLLIVIELLLPSCVAAIFEWNVLRYWGKISFSVYLLHSFVVFSNVVDHTPNLYYDRLVARFGLILLLATTSYHLVEYPSQLLAQKITRTLADLEASSSSGLSFSFEGKRRFSRAQHPTQIA